MPVSPETIGPATLALTQSVGLFQTFLPKFSEIQRGSISDTGLASDVRMGELAASTLALGIGAMTSSLVGSPVPMLISVVSIVGLITLYETALRHEGVALHE